MNEKYKIVEVSTDTNIGGAGRCLYQLAKHMDRDMFGITVILPPKSMLRGMIESLGVPVVEVEGIAEKSYDRKSVGRFREVFGGLKPDLVHAHASLSARIAAKREGAAIVYTRHSVFPPSKLMTTFPFRNINGDLNGYYADRAIAVAEAARQNLIDTGVSPDKITVILNGVDGYRKYGRDEIISAKKEFGVPNNNRVVSIVGRIEEIKGHEYFIKAADAVLRDTENVTFLIVGTGSLEEKYKGLVRSLGRDGDIIFTGYTDKTEAIMNITDIIVNASFGTEATSLSLLEAMSVGVPAVVSDFGGNTGVIDEGKNGFVVPQRDEAALASALKRLLADEELYGQMSAGACRIFGEKFTSMRMTAETEALYLDVIKEKRERSKHGH